MKSRQLKLAVTAGLASWMGLVGGCGHSDSTRPLTPEAFRGRSPLTAENPAQPIDQPMESVPPAPEPTARVVPSGVAPVVREQVPAPGQGPLPSTAEVRATVAPSTAPTTGPSLGQYMTVGGVVAEVNGIPIYANRVLGAVEPALAIRAKELDVEEFHRAAQVLIDKQVTDFVRDEVEVAAAQRWLEEDDKMLANRLTEQWRQRQITDAGGSVELARQRARAEGNDFDQLVQERSRRYLTEVYYQRKVIPRIQVTADDMRRYYQQHLDDQFTEHDQAQFRLIEISFRDMGGRDAAMKKAQEVLGRVKAGEDFAELAGTFNKNERLMKSKGDIGWIQHGAFRLEKVEKAVWTLQPNQTTDIVEDGNAFYIAKLEQRKVGRVAPFEEEAVQDKIRDTLRTQQFRAMREKIQENLKQQALIRVDQNMVNIAVDMAMQKYPQWAKK